MSRRTQKNVGVIGLGIIGRRVADILRRRGFHVFVWNRTPRPYPNFVGSPAELAELCDFIQIFVSDDNALLQMVEQMKRSLGAQHVIMAHSTVAPHTMRNAAEIVQRRGAEFLDAPFTGSKIPAEKGELVYYVAGDDAAFRRARPVLEASSKEIIEIGEIGQATTVKVATNMITATTVQAAAEALALVHNSGLAPEKFMAAMRGNASNSGTLAMKLPKMIEGDFDPHFSVKHMLKDVEIAARMARSHGLTLGATEAARDSLLDEADEGRGDQDFSSLVRFFFPEGLPGETTTADEEEAQATLAAVDEEAAAQVRREEREREESDATGADAEADARIETTAQAEHQSADEGSDEAEVERADAVAEQRTQGTTDVPESDAPDFDLGDTEAIPAEEKEPPARPEEDKQVLRASDETTSESAGPVSPAVGEIDEPNDQPIAPAVEETGEPPRSAPDTSVRNEEAETPNDERRDADGEGKSAVSTEETDFKLAEPGAAETAAVGVAEAPQRVLSEGAAHETSESSESVLSAPTPTESSEPAEAVAPETEKVAVNEAPEPARPSPIMPHAPSAEPSEDILSGEPPLQRHAHAEAAAVVGEGSRDKDEVAPRRGFLSRMFGKGPEY